MGALAANMRLWRERAGLTQEAASEAADLSVVYWKQLEHGTASNPSLASLVAAANALGVPPAELLRHRPRPDARPPGRPRAVPARLAANSDRAAKRKRALTRGR